MINFASGIRRHFSPSIDPDSGEVAKVMLKNGVLYDIGDHGEGLREVYESYDLCYPGCGPSNMAFLAQGHAFMVVFPDEDNMPISFGALTLSAKQMTTLRKLHKAYPDKEFWWSTENANGNTFESLCEYWRNNHV